MDQRNVDCGRTEKPAHTEITEEMRAAALRAARTRKPGGKIAGIVMTVALADYGAGGSMTAIAHRYGLSRNHLYEKAQQAGILKRITVPAYRTPEAALAALPVPQNAPTRTFTPHLLRAPEVWAEIEADYRAGHTGPELEARYGVPVATIRDRAKRKQWRRKDRKVDPLRRLPDPAQLKETADGDVVSAWDDIAHAAQRPPEGAWSTWLFQGGRGAGKTRAGAEWLAARAQASPRGRFALIGATLHDVREVMIDGPSGLRNLPGRERPLYEISRKRLVWPSNGAEAFAFSAEEPERLRGPQFEAAWADEFCTWKGGDYTLMLARMGLRLGSAPQLVVTTTPRPTKAMRLLRAETTCAVTQAPTSVNAAHLAPTFLEGLAAIYAGTRFERQELDGVLLDGEGALWRAQDLRAARGSAPATFERVVVAVDPPAGVEGAACGIVAAGRVGPIAYVLADRSMQGLTPLGWAARVVETAREFGAGEIVAEVNQGGDMVRSLLALADPACAVRPVFASAGKRARALPVAALYEQGRVVHAGDFPALEEEMMALGADGSEGRLDRADALVWAIGALLLASAGSPRLTNL